MTWFFASQSAYPMGLPVVVRPSAVEIHRSFKEATSPQSEIPHVLTIPQRLKILFVANNNMLPILLIEDKKLYINQQLLKRIRSGDLATNLTALTVGGLILIAIKLSGVDAFAILDQICRLNAPTVSPPFGPVPGGSTPTTLYADTIPSEQYEWNEMCKALNEPKGEEQNFIFSAEEALSILNSAYTGSLQVSETEHITDFQAGKKIYHASNFGVDPLDYGMTQEQVDTIERIGLTAYVRLGNTPPPIELIHAFQEALKDFCQHSNKFSDGTYASRGEQKIHDSTHYYNPATRQIVSFKIETQDLITSSVYNEKAFSRFILTKSLGRL